MVREVGLGLPPDRMAGMALGHLDAGVLGASVRGRGSPLALCFRHALRHFSVLGPGLRDSQLGSIEDFGQIGVGAVRRLTDCPGRTYGSAPAVGGGKGVTNVDEGTRDKWALVTAPVILGILADALLRALPWGLNVFIWVSLLAGFIIWATHDKTELWTKGGGWLVLPSVFFAAGFLWRDSQTLGAASLFALWVTASLAVFRAQGGRIFAAGLCHYALGAILGAGNAFLGVPLMVYKDISWEGMLPGRWQGRAPAAARGLLLAVPPVVVFALLFASADAVFAAYLREIFHFNLLTLLSHLFVFSFFAWTSAGLLRGLLVGNELSWTAKVQPPQLRLGVVEIGVMLGAVNLTFLAFVIVQFRYFFGGAGLVQATTGLTYAEYARRGFFELVTASALVLPLLLGCHWLSAKNSSRDE